jgi:SAM-dependent methyltransferase
MSVDPQTIKTYNASAAQLATHFQVYKGGAVLDPISRSFALAANLKDGMVVEIGCGAGKDAAEIVKYTDQYEGFDPAEELLAIARQQVPEASFTEADALGYTYPVGAIIVFAFASLLHLNREDFAAVAAKVAESLQTGGVFCMTLKEADSYTEQVQEDDFGTRLFYLYSPELVRKMLEPAFELVYEGHDVVGPKKKKWMNLIFVKLYIPL